MRPKTSKGGRRNTGPADLEHETAAQISGKRGISASGAGVGTLLLGADAPAVTLFDEVALSNDISAGCGGAQATVHAPSPLSVETRLATLESLRGKGLATEDE